VWKCSEALLLEVVNALGPGGGVANLDVERKTGDDRTSACLSPRVRADFIREG
jgi:hypothetical protein